MKKMNYRILSVVLVIAILASALGISSAVWAEGVIDIGNYPALKGFVSGTAPAASSWSFDMKDYGEKAPMTKSDTDFKAPTVNWDVDNEMVTFDWTAVSGAASYKVNVYEGISLVKTYSNITENTYTVNHAQSGLTGGKDYEAQVVALDAAGKIISASCIRQFTAEGKPQYKYVVQDYNATGLTSSDVVFATRDADTAFQSVSNGVMSFTMGDAFTCTYFKFPYNSANALKDNSSGQKASYIYVKMSASPYLSTRLIPRFMTSIADKESVVDGVTYPVYKSYATGVTSGTVAGKSFYYVSAANPYKYTTVANGNANRGGYTPTEYAEMEDGYYCLIPLDMYSETVQKDIKAGTFDGFGFTWEGSPKIYNSTSGNYDDPKSYSGVTVNIDEVGFITDVNGWISQMQDEYDPVAADERTSYAFEGDLGVLTADTFDATQNTYKNAKFSSFYKFQNDNSARRITFTAVSSFTNQYGANLTFTAPKSGYYDLANKLEVVNNSVVETSTVNYRVFKKAADGTETTVYPFDTTSGEYYSLNVSADNLNPAGAIAAPMVHLNAGEKIVIEAYADIEAGGQLEINLGNPTMTPVAYSETYKGSQYEWSFGNYVPHFEYDGAVSTGNFDQASRWSSSILHTDPSTGEETYMDVPNHLQYDNFTGLKMLYNENRSYQVIGYYYYINVDQNKQQEMKIKVGTEYGVSFKYTAPTDGSAVLTIPLGEAVKYRILLNGTKVYPQDFDWENGNTFSYPADVKLGDEITIDIVSKETYSNYYDAVLSTVTTAPKIIMNTGNLSNSVGDSTFAPLWERPYAGKNYTGKFTAIEGDIWKFQTSSFPSTTTVKSYDVNYYNSKTKELYTVDDGLIEVKEGEELVLPDSKFIFSGEQLKAYIGTAKDGVSLTFTAPELGYYDFSTAINVLSGTLNDVNGAGNLSVRVQVGGKTVWPEDGAWKTVEDIKVGSSIKFEAMEFALEVGDTIVLQVYAPSLTKADGGEGEPDPMVIGFGSPAVQHITDKTFTETGNTTVYRPSSFTVMEKGYSGAYIPIDSRFNITIDGKAPVSVNSANGTMTVDANNKIVYGSDGTTKLTIQKGKTAAVEFTVPFDGSGTYEVTTPAVSGVKYRLLKNGEVISAFAATLPKATDITAVKGDVFTLEIQASANATVALSEFNITLSGLHNNQNSAADKAYYASFAVPYNNDKYTGDYNETESGYWKFRLYDAITGEIKNANTYDYTNNKKLYNTDMQNVGYYFIENNNRLAADIYTNQLFEADNGDASSDSSGSSNESVTPVNYGVALGFNAPKAGTFNIRAGLNLETSGAKATMMIRIVQNTTDDGGNAVTKTIWPAESDGDGWYEETITAGQNITIPYAEFTFKEGDMVYLQCYAKEASAESIKINLSSPGVVEDNVVKIEHVDVGVRVYDFTKYKPYGHFEVKGSEYTTTNYVPMENRWNYEYIDINPDTGDVIGTLQPDYYRIGGTGTHEIMYKGSAIDLGDGTTVNAGNALWLNYTSGTPKTTSRFTAGGVTYYKYVGSSKRFVAPSTAEYELIGITPMITSVIEGGSVRYRIIKLSASTGEQTTVWPSADALTHTWTDSSGNVWEELSNKQLTSEADVLKVELETGDQLMFQMYNYVSKANLDAYLTEANANLAEDAQPVVKWSPDGTFSPNVVVYDYITEKSIHTTTTGFMYDYQLSPYWKIQTADTPTGEWRDNTRFSWSYWMDSLYAYRGISPNNKWQLQNYDNLWPEDHQPRISYRFTVRQDGYLTTEGTVTFGSPYFYLDEAQTQLPSAYARITFNGESLTGDWSKVSKENSFEYSIKGLEVKAGDILRYELMYNDGDVYINWTPTLNINKYKDVYSNTDDIYNMLTKEMTAHFMAMDPTTAYEAENPAALALSEAIAARKAAAAERGPDYLLNADNEEDSSDVSTDDEYQDTESGDESKESRPEDDDESEESKPDADYSDDDEVISGDSGDYREWTEEIYTPGGGYKKIRRIYSTSWWVYALIIAGCVAVAAGITVLTVILVKKKRKKSANNKT